MNLGIVACDILKPEIEFLTKGDPDFTEREYLEFALHEYPKDMKNKILETVGKMEDKVDGVLIGYAICQSLEGITNEIKVPAVMLPGADCIDALLTTDEYNKEKKICPGTWFVSPGWAEEGKNGIIKELHLDAVEGYPPEFFLDILFASYERTLFIDTGIGNEEEYRKKSESLAKELKLTHSCRKCNLDQFRDAIKELKDKVQQ